MSRYLMFQCNDFLIPAGSFNDRNSFIHHCGLLVLCTRSQTSYRANTSIFAVLLQMIAGTIASFIVGMVWYSPFFFGHIWWRYEFPEKRFGDYENNTDFPIYCTIAALVLQSVVLTGTVHILLEIVDPSVLCDLPIMGFPLGCSVVIGMVVACASLPHYVFTGKPFPLFLVCATHDLVQIAAAICVIYLLA